MDYVAASSLSDTLVIAPRTDLVYVDAEVSAVVNALHARLLQGEVLYDDLAKELTEGKPKIIWFSTHGLYKQAEGKESERHWKAAEAGILLSKQTILTVAELVPLLHLPGQNVELVYLNTCWSLDLALALQNQLDLNFICTVREVPDELAYRTGRSFAIHLARGMSYYNAYKQARPGQNSTFVYLAGSAPQIMSPPNSQQSSPRLQQEPEEFDPNFALKQLIAVVNGDKGWNTPGILPILNSLQESMRKLQWSIWFLRAVCALLFAMTLLTLLAVFFLLRGQ